MIRKFTVSRDDSIYEAFPDVALTRSGTLVCVFAECTHHGDRSYTRIMLTRSIDRGRTWSAKRPLTEPLNKADDGLWWNCPRISTLADGRLAVVVDRCLENILLLSDDEGASWSEPIGTPVYGKVPDRLVELRYGDAAGRWVLSAHLRADEAGGDAWLQRCWVSDDQGAGWQGPFTIAADPDLMLCEGSVMELPDGELVCFMRENSFTGLDAYKAVSRDAGRSWGSPTRFPLPACHRPVAGMLADGRVLITHRFMPGGKGWLGWWTQNLFAAMTDVDSCLARARDQAHARILPIDFDRSAAADTGYSGWVQFDDGEVYIVNYILDDAPTAQIRGYAVNCDDFLLPDGDGPSS